VVLARPVGEANQASLALRVILLIHHFSPVASASITMTERGDEERKEGIRECVCICLSGCVLGTSE
jgi:hypothetical protein